jgi:hypothetical protein
MEAVPLWDNVGRRRWLAAPPDAAVQLFDEQRITLYIEEKIREHVSDGDFAYWQFIHSITPTDSVDLLGGTRKLFQQLGDFRSELEKALHRRRERDPEDFGDIVLDPFFIVPTKRTRIRMVESANGDETKDDRPGPGFRAN